MMMDILGKALYEAVDESFTAMGKPARTILFGYLQKHQSTKSVSALDWAKAVREILQISVGRASRLLSMFIAERLYRKLGIEFHRRDNWSLLEYVEDARIKLEGMERAFPEAPRTGRLVNPY